MSTILPPDPKKPIRSAFWYCANGCFYGLAIALVAIALLLKFTHPSETREAWLFAVPTTILFCCFWWFAKKGMNQDG